MSDEKRREELKVKINEQLDKLSIEELESVAGGDGCYAVYCSNCGALLGTYASIWEAASHNGLCPNCKSQCGGKQPQEDPHGKKKHY